MVESMNRIMKELKNNKAFNYIIMLSAVITLIISLMGGCLFFFYYSTIYDDYTTANDEYLSSIVNRHENDIQIITDIVSQIGISDTITEFKLNEKPLISIEVEQQLHQYFSVSQFFEQIFLLFHEDTYLYNNSTSVQIDRFMDSGVVLEDTTKEEMKSLLYSEERGLKVLKEQEIKGYLVQKYNGTDSKAVTFFIPIAPKYEATVMFVVGNSYYDTLLASQEEKRETYIVYENEVIIKRGSLEIDDDSIVELLSKNKEADEVTIQNEKYYATIQQGESGITYCTLQSVSVFHKKILYNRWIYLFFLLFVSMPAAIAMIILTKKAADRVRKISTLLNEDKNTEYGLDKIENGILALIENNIEVKNASRSLGKSRLIGKFIRGEYNDRASLIEAGKLVGLHLEKKYFVVALLGDRGNSNASEVYGMMTSKFHEDRIIDGYGINLVSHNQSLLVFFGDETEDLKKQLKKVFEIGKEMCEDTIMSISEYHTEIEEASQAYLEADTAFDNRFLVDNSDIICFADINGKEVDNRLPDMYMPVLKNAIRSGSEEKIADAVHEICSYLQSRQQSLLSFRMLYNDILQVLIREWRPSDSSFKHFYSVFTLSQCLTVKDFSDLLCEACIMLIGNVKNDENTEQSKMETAVEYMMGHFHNPDLTMGFLAEYLKMSAVTLSVEFKNYMEMSPSEYLTLLRMEKAKELLKETEKRIKEISIAVGYEDDHVFMRRFKKYTGKTPAQFRNEFLENNKQ